MPLMEKRSPKITRHCKQFHREAIPMGIPQSHGLPRDTDNRPLIAERSPLIADRLPLIPRSAVQPT
jgi:hypothetical protein